VEVIGDAHRMSPWSRGGNRLRQTRYSDDPSRAVKLDGKFAKAAA
jgi:hypothetical protein